MKILLDMHNKLSNNDNIINVYRLYVNREIENEIEKRKKLLETLEKCSVLKEDIDKNNIYIFVYIYIFYILKED